MKNYTEVLALNKIRLNAVVKFPGKKILAVLAGSCGLKFFGAIDYLRKYHNYLVIWERSKK